jgi:hypothetical protein
MRLGSSQLGIPRPASPSRGGTSSNSAQAGNPQILPFLFFESVFDSSHQLLFSHRPFPAELHLFPLALIPAQRKFSHSAHDESDRSFYVKTDRHFY